MGSKQSKPSEPEPQLYAVATPHPTMKWIYPVYAAPMDALPPPEKKGRSSPLAWLGEKSKGRVDIPVVAEHHERVPIATDADGVNEDGIWYHFHVDAGGAVDYIRPGTTLPNAFPEPASYAPRTFEGSTAPSMSMAGVPYEESYYSYPASPAYQGYHHPQPQRISHSDAYSMGSLPYPRARSVSPVYSRAITPTNLKPRRATTPTPRRSKTPNYEPAPPVPEHIAPVATRRSQTPFPPRKVLPTAPSPRMMDPRDYTVEQRDYRIDQRDYRLEQRDHRGEYRDPKTALYGSVTSGRTSRGSRRPSPDEDSTAIASSSPHDHSSIALKSVQSRPYSPIPPSDATFHGGSGNQNLRSAQQKYARHYPSPSTINSQPTSRPDVYA